MCYLVRAVLSYIRAVLFSFFETIHFIALVEKETKVSPGKKQVDSQSLVKQAITETSKKILIASEVEISVSNNLKSFDYNDLKNTTKNFRSENFLGEGGFGGVYKGWIDEHTLAPTKPGSGIVVAIKKLKSQSFQGHREWLVCFLV